MDPALPARKTNQTINKPICIYVKIWVEPVQNFGILQRTNSTFFFNIYQEVNTVYPIHPVFYVTNLDVYNGVKVKFWWEYIVNF